MAVYQKPQFSQDYVIRATCDHLMLSVDRSIAKCCSRIEEFENDKTQSTELFKALGRLHCLRKDVEQLIRNHSGK